MTRGTFWPNVSPTIYGTPRLGSMGEVISR